MTGYGRGECVRDGLKVTVELSSVNRRQAEVAVALPRELELLENLVRDMINRHVARGRVSGRVSLQVGSNGAGARPHINVPLATAYAQELKALARRLKLAGPVTLDHLVRAPGVFQTEEELAAAENLWPAVRQALRQALQALVRMREREGAHLARDLAARVAVMRRCAARIRAQAPRAAARYRRQLLQRVRAAGLAAATDDERLLKEVVLFADRVDIVEELTRLESHFRQFDACRRSRQPVGRTLDFLAQEINREINTIGSKANDARIARQVVVLKAELERFREQAQNVE